MDQGRAGGNRALIGCPKGSWDVNSKRCRVATKTHKVYLFTDKKRCPKGYRKQ